MNGRFYSYSYYVELNIKNNLHDAKDRFCHKVSSASLSSETPHFLPGSSEEAG